MKICLLSVDEIKNIYFEYMVNDFPSDELKPLERILEMYEAGYYFAYGMYDNDVLFGYAYFVNGEKSNSVLLDYFAVVSDKRDKGYGSEFLTLLKDELQNYNYFILESERIESAQNDNEINIRTRRIEFYKRNGFKLSDIESNLFGVDYSILYVNNGNSGVLYDAVADIYNKMFYPKYINKVKVSYKGVLK